MRFCEQSAELCPARDKANMFVETFMTSRTDLLRLLNPLNYNILHATTD
jgi:hypothetical protein